MSYPTAYRSQSNPFRGTPAFKGVQPTASGNNPWNSSAGMGYGSRRNFGFNPDRAESGRTLLHEWEGRGPIIDLPFEDVPSGEGRALTPAGNPNPYNKGSSMGYGSASRSAARTAARIMPAAAWASLAYDAAAIVGPIAMKWYHKAGLGWGTCFEGCPPPHNGFTKTYYYEHVSCAYTHCVSGTGDPGGSEMPGPKKTAAVDVYHHEPNCPPFADARWDVVANYLWTGIVGSVIDWPGLFPGPSEYDKPIALPFPEMQPIQKPVGDPWQVPFADLGYRPNTDYRDAGYALPDTGTAVDAPWGGTSTVLMPDPWAMGNGGQGFWVPVDTDHRRPPLKTDERKYSGSIGGMLWQRVGVLTEVDEALTCLWKSLPKEDTKRILGHKVAGQTLYYWKKGWARRKGIDESKRQRHNELFKLGKPVHQTPQQKIADILANPGHLDRRKFEDCMLQDMAVDAAIGKSSSGAARNFRNFQKANGFNFGWMHLGTGPVM